MPRLLQALTSVIVLIAFSLTFASSSNTHAQESRETLAEEDFRTYRGMLVAYQPEFTVEGGRMVTRRTAEQRTALTAELNTCTAEQAEVRSPGTCTVSARGTTFESGEFTWYVWYEQVSGYSRASQVKTRIAKFPSNPSGMQTSYAVFTYQGHWELLGTHPHGYALIDREYASPYYDSWNAVMFFSPDIDYPIFAHPARAQSSKYGTSYYYYEADTPEIITIIRCDTECVLYHRHLETGEFVEQYSTPSTQEEPGLTPFF